MKISLLSVEKEGVVQLATEGTITATNFDASGTNPLEGVLGVKWAQMRILMSFEKTEYIDSSAIGWLIGTVKQLKAGGGAMVLYHVQPAVHQIFDILKVDRIIPIADTEAAARELLCTAAASAQGGGAA